ncbi:ATP-binding cassette domain-containing protein [Siccirubricoccus deserti]
MTLHLTGIRHAYGGHEVLRGIELSVGRGEILCLLGPSGDGKTTLLRLVAGLEPLQAGRIELGGVVVAEPGRRCRRSSAMSASSSRITRCSRI